MYTVRCIAKTSYDLPILPSKLVAGLYRFFGPVTPIQFILEDRQRKWMLYKFVQYNLQIIKLQMHFLGNRISVVRCKERMNANPSIGAV